MAHIRVISKSSPCLAQSDDFLDTLKAVIGVVGTLAAIMGQLGDLGNLVSKD